MSFGLASAGVREVLESLGILGGFYLAARVVSYLASRALARAASRTHAGLDHRLINALKRPLTHAIALIGAYVAVHRLPDQDVWTDRVDDLLFGASAFVLAVGAIRVYTLMLYWYATESAAGADSPLAREFTPLLTKLGRLFIALVALIAVLRHLQVDVNSLVVSLGVGSLAVGLAAQDTLANMFAGFTLMLDRPFRIGDRIQLTTGELGDVVTIGLRATRIRTIDETILVVPNSVLVKERLVNQSQPTRQVTVRVEVGVDYGSDPVAVRRVLVEAALASPFRAAEPPPAALLLGFGDSALSFRLICQAKDYLERGQMLDDLHERVYRGLAAAGIGIPYPVRRVIQGPPGPPAPERGPGKPPPVGAEAC